MLKKSQLLSTECPKCAQNNIISDPSSRAEKNRETAPVLDKEPEGGDKICLMLNSQLKAETDLSQESSGLKLGVISTLCVEIRLEGC